MTVISKLNYIAAPGPQISLLFFVRCISTPSESSEWVQIRIKFRKTMPMTNHGNNHTLYRFWPSAIFLIELYGPSTIGPCSSTGLRSRIGLYSKLPRIDECRPSNQIGLHNPIDLQTAFKMVRSSSELSMGNNNMRILVFIRTHADFPDLPDCVFCSAAIAIIA